MIVSSIAILLLDTSHVGDLLNFGSVYMYRRREPDSKSFTVTVRYLMSDSDGKTFQLYVESGSK